MSNPEPDSTAVEPAPAVEPADSAATEAENYRRALAGGSTINESEGE